MPFIKVDVSDVTKKVEKLAKNLADPSGVFSKTMSDMNRRASGKVADAVRNVFTIKKAEIVPSKQKTDLKKAGTIKVSGQTIADFKLYYEGRRLTPLHFGMTPKELPNNKKYRIYQKVKKNRTILAKPDKQGYVPFLAPASKGSSRIIPFQRHLKRYHYHKWLIIHRLGNLLIPNWEICCINGLITIINVIWVK